MRSTVKVFVRTELKKRDALRPKDSKPATPATYVDTKQKPTPVPAKNESVPPESQAKENGVDTSATDEASSHPVAESGTPTVENGVTDKPEPHNEVDIVPRASLSLSHRLDLITHYCVGPARRRD